MSANQIQLATQLAQQSRSMPVLRCAGGYLFMYGMVGLALVRFSEFLIDSEYCHSSDSANCEKCSRINGFGMIVLRPYLFQTVCQGVPIA